MSGEKPKKVSGNRTCVVCGLDFFYVAKRIPTTCGALHCRAVDEWTEDDWAGAARMARARQETGTQIRTSFTHDDDDKRIYTAWTEPVELTPLDVMALNL